MSRLGGFFASRMEKAGGTELEIAIARVVGDELQRDKGDGVSISSADLAARCFKKGVHWKWHRHPPALSTVSLVLEYLEQFGLLAWAKGHVRRWCERRGCDHAPFPLPRPVRHAEGRWMLPKRRIFVVGFGATLALAPAARASSIDTASEKSPRAERASETPLSKAVQKSSTVSSIEDAPEADARERAAWLERMKQRLLR